MFSSHVLAEVESVCDRVGILKQGRLVHLQDMAELRQARRIRARLKDSTAPRPPEVPGLTVRAQRDGELEMECRNGLAAVLSWLSRQAVLDLRIEPLGLSSIYQRYQGEAA
jgi:ABC-2 type transport system ATP-binding protein